MNKIKDFFMTIGKKILTTVCVLALGFVFITGLGELLPRGFKVPLVESKSAQPVIRNNKKLNMKVRNAMDIAHNAAYEYASAELDLWINEMMSRADQYFLNDYFSFIQTKRREVTSLFYTVTHTFNSSSQTAEKATLKELEDLTQSYSSRNLTSKN